MAELKRTFINLFLILTILSFGTGCTSLESHRSNLNCGQVYLSHETLDFIQECKPTYTVMANIAQVQGSAAINQGLNDREPVVVQEQSTIKKYLIATGGVIIGGWVAIKLVFGKIFSWFI